MLLRRHWAVNGVSQEEFVSAPARGPRSRLDQCPCGASLARNNTDFPLCVRG